MELASAHATCHGHARIPLKPCTLPSRTTPCRLQEEQETVVDVMTAVPAAIHATGRTGLADSMTEAIEQGAESTDKAFDDVGRQLEVWPPPRPTRPALAFVWSRST